MTFNEYKVRSLSINKEKALVNCNRLCFRYSSINKMANIFVSYEFFLSKLSSMSHIEVVNLKNLFSDSNFSKDKAKVVFRHDIDHDLTTAVEMSKVEKKFNLLGTYFIHHSSPFYYGFFDKDLIFNRYQSLADCYLEIQSNGAEVGVHIDPFQIYRLGIDGAEALVCEIKWLRGIGLKISTVSTHGSAPHYGAENFEIFKEWQLYERDTVSSLGAGAMPLGLFAFSEEAHRQFSGSDSLPKKVDLPLGVLSAEELGLKLEANFASPVDNVDWDRVELYFKKAKTDDIKTHLSYYLHKNSYCRWGQDYTIWLYGWNTWVIAATDSQGIFIPDASTLDVIKFLGSLSGGEKAVLHIHPVYLGYRFHPDSGPATVSHLTDKVGIELESYITNPEYFIKIIDAYHKEDYKQLNERVNRLDKECACWKERAESLRKFVLHNIKRMIK